MLLLALDPTSSPQVPRIRGVHAVYKFVKRTTIPEVESEPDSRTFGASDELDTLQDEQLKSDNPIGVTLTISYAVNIHCKDCGKPYTTLTIQCVLALGFQTDKFSNYLATYHTL